jgi:YggT family protein
MGVGCKPRPCGEGPGGLGSDDRAEEYEGLMGPLVNILHFVLGIVWFFVLAHVVMSWLIGFNVLNRHQPLVHQIWSGLNGLLEPIYRPIRRLLPDTGGLDLSPLVLIVILYAIGEFLPPRT